MEMIMGMLAALSALWTLWEALATLWGYFASLWETSEPLLRDGVKYIDNGLVCGQKEDILTGIFMVVSAAMPFILISILCLVFVIVLCWAGFVLPVPKWESVKRPLTLMLLPAAMLPALSQAQSAGVSVPLMLAPDSERQGFVRIINETRRGYRVRVTAVDDAGNAAGPIEIELEAGTSVHFNSDDLADGNEAKGIDGIGRPQQGHWRLRVEAAEGVHVMAFVRTREGFLTTMHDVLPRDSQGRLVDRMMNPGSNRNQESSLRLINTGENSESVSIRGTDDLSRSAGPVTLTLDAGQARTISAFDLENGAQGLTGSLGDGAGKWRLTIEAGQAVMGVGLLETPGGPISNISTTGVAPAERAPTNPGGQGDGFADAYDLGAINEYGFENGTDYYPDGHIEYMGESDYYRVSVSESGLLEVSSIGIREEGETEDGLCCRAIGPLDTRGYLYDSEGSLLASNDDGGFFADSRTGRMEFDFRFLRKVDAGTYYVRVEAYHQNAVGRYHIQAHFFAFPPKEPPTNPLEFYGALAYTPTFRSEGVPLVGGFSWGYRAEQGARDRALRECGHSECRAEGLYVLRSEQAPTYNRTERSCGALGRFEHSETLRKAAVFGTGSTVAEAQANVLGTCEYGGVTDCELWPGMVACADGSHPGGLMIREQP